jgi:hypothetical protein
VLALGLVAVIGVVTLHLVVSPQTAEDIVRAVYQRFQPEGPPYGFVDEVAARSSHSIEPRLVRVQGYAGAIVRQGNRTEFALRRNGYSAQVFYAGITPSGLVEGNVVVVTGLLSRDKTLRATQVSARPAP